ncbi:MAG: TPM domain-containing protein [Hyphomicrobiales bacterium]|nr:TPM domain-containing protein [Hyphomicrobiales bacterium]MDE2114079.1 TPM domain-containing protein [Hyphomicrobiales bacterium]
MELTPADHARISDAIAQAERQTRGEIVCVLAHASSDYANVPLLWASMIALIVPWPLIAFTQMSVQRIYIMELVVFIGLFLLLSRPALRLWLVPKRVLRAQAHRAALGQFMMRGVSNTTERTGILIYVSLAERYARVIADEGIAAKIAQPEWQQIVDALVAHAQKGDMATGFVEAVAAAGRHLAAHFPPDATPKDQLPNRIYVV